MAALVPAPGCMCPWQEGQHLAALPEKEDVGTCAGEGCVTAEEIQSGARGGCWWWDPWQGPGVHRGCSHPGVWRATAWAAVRERMLQSVREGRMRAQPHHPARHREMQWPARCCRWRAMPCACSACSMPAVAVTGLGSLGSLQTNSQVVCSANTAAGNTNTQPAWVGCAGTHQIWQD